LIPILQSFSISASIVSATINLPAGALPLGCKQTLFAAKMIGIPPISSGSFIPNKYSALAEVAVNVALSRHPTILKSLFAFKSSPKGNWVGAPVIA
jgi:hypothetical protein